MLGDVWQCLAGAAAHGGVLPATRRRPVWGRGEVRGTGLQRVAGEVGGRPVGRSRVRPIGVQPKRVPRELPLGEFAAPQAIVRSLG